MSYKKTTGTASLIRHKCKAAKLHSPKKEAQDSLISLLTQSKPPLPPPALTPAPTFDAPSSTVVSSTGRSEKPSILEVAGKNLALAQIRWLCQSLMSTQIVGDPSYLAFLQNLVNFGADFGKQNISTVINRNVICQQMIPNQYEHMRSELANAMKGTEFTISFHEWSSIHDGRYVTVVGYFFTSNFEYRSHILGTRQCTNDVASVVREISDGYKTIHDAKLKCIEEGPCEDYETYPCMIGQISKVIVAAIDGSADSKEFFKKIYKLAHEVLDIPLKTTFEGASNEQRVKIFYELYQHGNENIDFEFDPMAKKFTLLLGSLFAAISSLTATTDSGDRCVTSSKVYLWFKKLLKLYSSLEDESAGRILSAIEKMKIPEIYQIAVFLDPNFKSLKFLEAPERVVLLENVRRNLRRLIGDDDSMQPPSKKQKVLKSHLNDTFVEFMDMSMESVDDQVNSEVQCYMGLKLENPVQIVEFWRDTDCFPYLKKLARNILSLPSCTFHSNCCFLGAGNELYTKFQNLPADEIETFTFLHQQ